MKPNTQKGRQQIEKINFLMPFFLIFGPWAVEFVIFDPQIGFYVKFPPHNRLERSRIWNPGPKMRKLIFQHVTVSQNSGSILRRNRPPNEKRLYTRVTLINTV